MSDRLLLDTDVIVDYLRGRTQAIEYLEARTEALLLSAMTTAEHARAALVTLNRKHFPMVEGLRVPYERQ